MNIRKMKQFDNKLIVVRYDDGDLVKELDSYSKSKLYLVKFTMCAQ